MENQIYLVKAFSKDSEKGNPAGVVLNADNLNDEQMIEISAKLGFSESAFLQNSNEADYRVRFFSPKQEVDLCGHATIATFHVIREKIKKSINKITLTQETKAGIFPVECMEDGLIVMTQDKPKFIEYVPDKNEILKLLHISESDFLNYPLQIVSTGTPKLIIPVKSLDVLWNIQPDFEGIIEFCKKSGAKGFYPFTFETKEEKSDFHARQFNPLAGINEDPITGIAAGALGAYIKHHQISDKNRFIIEQGYIMNKAGKIIVEVGDEIKVGGYATIFDEKIL